LNDLFFENIDMYVYEECDSEQMKLFFEHIKTCKKCAEEYELACSVKDAMSSMQLLTPPADFSKLVNERLDREISTERKRRFMKPGYRKYSAVAACLVLAAVLGIDGVNLVDKTTVDENRLIYEKSLPESSAQSDESTPKPSAAPTEEIQEQIIPAAPEATKAPEIESSAPVVSKTENRPASNPKKTEKSEPAKAETPVEEVFEIPSQMQAEATVVQYYDYEQMSQPIYPQSVVTEQVTSPVQETQLVSPEPVVVSGIKIDPAENGIPSYMDPREQVVLASTVEREYQTSGFRIEDLPTKERDLSKEFALLENNKGAIITTPANLASLEGVEIKEIKDNRKSVQEYGIGSGSIFISAKDKDAVNEIISKYIADEEGNYYFFTGENYKTFINEIQNSGIEYKQTLVSENGTNVAFRLIIS